MYHPPGKLSHIPDPSRPEVSLWSWRRWYPREVWKIWGKSSMCDPWFSWRVLIRTNCSEKDFSSVCPDSNHQRQPVWKVKRAMAPWLKSVWGKLWWMREIFARWLESKVFQTTISVWFLVPQISLGFIKFAETSDAEKVLRTWDPDRPSCKICEQHWLQTWEDAVAPWGKFCINISEPTWSHSNRIPWDLKDHGWSGDLRPQMWFP